MLSYTTDPISDPLRDTVDVTIDFGGGRKGWLFFITPQQLAAVGDWIEGTRIRLHLGERHMIIVGELSEAVIDKVLRQLDASGELESRTLPLESASAGLKESAAAGPPIESGTLTEVMVQFFRRLEAIGEQHDEVTDTDVLDAIAETVEEGFLRATPEFQVPQGYRMFSWHGDRDVTRLLEWFLPAVRAAARAEGLDTFHKRVAAWNRFECEELDWTGNGVWKWDRADFDESGNRHR